MQVLSTPSAGAYTSVAEAFARISSIEGFRGLWRGIASVILGAGPAHAIYFGAYEKVKDLTGGNREGHQFASTGTYWTWPLRTHRAAFAGATATITSDAFMNPFDGTLVRHVRLTHAVIKQRMQLQESGFTSIAQCARTLYRTEGLRAFYVSYPTTLTMTVPFTAIQFATYEWSKDMLNPKNVYSPMSHMLAGGFAGAVAAAVTTPLDVAKTLLQTRGCNSDPLIRSTTTMTGAFRVIMQREGVRGFARGLTPRVLTHMPSNALCWLSYEGFRFLMKKNVNV